MTSKSLSNGKQRTVYVFFHFGIMTINEQIKQQVLSVIRESVVLDPTSDVLYVSVCSLYTRYFAGFFIMISVHFCHISYIFVSQIIWAYMYKYNVQN